MIIALQTLVFFRESILAAIDRLLRPYYKRFALIFLHNRNRDVSDDEDSDDQVFAEFDDEKGVIFFPPVYFQRYAAVSDCLMDARWSGKLEKVVDFGYHDMSFMRYLIEVPGIKHILGVDLESILLRCSSDLFGSDDLAKRESPYQILLFQGNAADPDYRLIGCDAITAIEMIEHMLPHDLERLVHTVFGFIKPWIVVITTPNGDFNPLFNSLQNNGLRRLDHFFEWSREQFNDWCANIVVRYPQYTVSCKGIGPGPIGTAQYGCCSQLALFVSTDYHKQQDLNINSLSLVQNPPSPNVTDIECSGSQDSLIENKMISSRNVIESYTEIMISNKESYVDLVFSPVIPTKTLEFLDKSSQCNLDIELGKNFLMFDDAQNCPILVPRRRTDNRVYVIRDDYRRLNCTTLQVKKFSKPTQSLLEKSTLASSHNRDVVDEIRRLTKALKLNGDVRIYDSTSTWCNFNWGDNAPYWNQYYKIVKEYKYPFKTNSEEWRILDLILEEINRLIDSNSIEDSCVDANKVEIPIEHLMSVIQHITKDVDRVKNLLEWNGYEVEGDTVIYSRLVVDNESAGSLDDEWRDDFSDWDTEIRSNSFSGGSMVLPNYHGRFLYRTINNKIGKLRNMMSADEDMSRELDIVICRLLKLALKASRRHHKPPPTKWMLYKLFDLLTLTEKAIQKKREHFVENFALKAMYYDNQSNGLDVIQNKIKEDNIMNDIVNKYKHLVSPSEVFKSVDNILNEYTYALDDLSHKTNTNLSIEPASSEITFYDIVRSPSLFNIQRVPSPVKISQMYCNKFDYNDIEEQSSMSRIQAWVNDDGNEINQTSGDSGQRINSLTRFKNKKSHRKRKPLLKFKDELDMKTGKKMPSKILPCKRIIKRKVSVKYNKIFKIRFHNKITENKAKYNVLGKSYSTKLLLANLSNIVENTNKETKKRSLNKKNSKPISGILKNSCLPVNGIDVNRWESDIAKIGPQNAEICSKNNNVNLSTKDVATTEESNIIHIIMEDKEETIALLRTIGTDAEEHSDFSEHEQDMALGSLTNIMKVDSFCQISNNEIRKGHSESIFIYDINEPSTSKGIRHVSMDVQCGPDATNTYAKPFATTSFSRLPDILNTGVKIKDSTMNMNTVFYDSCHIKNNSFQSLNSRMKSVGIKIKDSNTNLIENTEYNTLAPELDVDFQIKPLINPSQLKSERARSTICKIPKRSQNISKNLSDTQLKRSEKNVWSKLSCGGVYVHSYKNKEVSEDVVYYGNWQQRWSKSSVKRRCCNPNLHASNKKNKSNVEGTNNQKQGKRHLVCVNITKNNEDFTQFNKVIKPVPSRGFKTKRNTNAIKVASKLSARKNTLTPNSRISNVKKKPSPTQCIDKKDNKKAQRCIRKTYLPLYLRRKSANIKTNSNLESDTNKSKTGPEKVQSSLQRQFPVLDEIKKVMLNFNPETKSNINYVVFRNEIKIGNGSSTDCEAPLSNREIGMSKEGSRSLSPESQNSSPCSSPNSIATVRMRPTKAVSGAKHSLLSNKINVEYNQSNNLSVQNKKFTKRSKSTKQPQDKVIENKENLPECSKKNENSKKYIKNCCKDIFRAQITTDLTQSMSKNMSTNKQSTKSNIRIPLASSRSARNLASSESSKNSLPNIDPLETKMTQKKYLTFSKFPDISTSTIETVQNDSAGFNATEDDDETITKVVDNNLVTELMQSSHRNAVDNGSILNAMKQLVEESLDFIDPLPTDMDIDSETVVLGRESVSLSEAASLHDFIDSYSFGAIVEQNNSNVSRVDVESINVISGSNCDTFEDELTITTLNEDLLSNKSFPSKSKTSEYFSPPNEIKINNSIRDIFERKLPTPVQNSLGPLAAQAFSGFSMNAEPVLCEQPNPVNIVDSETGSVAAERTRQITSEEVFISGRSSDSYESCLLDEDVVVPYWLFQIISQQQSLDEEEEESGEPLPNQIPVSESMFDVNANIIEPGIGAAVGAGDGHGIHSDLSQDTSGRGTSLSSSATFSGQSETIDVAALAPHHDFVDLGSSLIISPAPVTTNDSPDVSFFTADSSENVRLNETVDSAGEPQRPAIINMAASDADADISSLDTDYLDSDY